MREIGHIVLVMLPCFFGGLTVVTLTFAFWSMSWPTVKGTIDVSIYDREWSADASGSEVTIEKKGRFYLAYSYSVGGRAFQGSRISPLVESDWQFTGVPDLSSAHDKAQWYREGAVVDVHYCPMFPAWACLEPGGFLIAAALGLVTVLTAFLK
jgi:hypothetical protein